MRCGTAGAAYRGRLRRAGEQRQIPTCGRARMGTWFLRRPAETLRAAPWRTPPVLALQGALGDSGALLAVLRSGEPNMSCMGPQKKPLPIRPASAATP
jgi:hypothetical protein